MSDLRLLLFTDLDGTLLDRRTYSAVPAREALAELRRRHVPVVFCTSKARAEVEALRSRINNRDPFIVENGGGIFIPRGYFRIRLPGARPAGHYLRIALGRPYREMIASLEQIAAAARVQVLGFHQMGAREVARHTGLPPGEARRALAREFDEPFLFVRASEAAKGRFAARAKSRGLEVVRGDRFWHLFSGCDKGRAVRTLASIYRAAWCRRLHTVALGNSSNDLPMLAAANLAVLLPGDDGRFDRDVLVRLRDVRRGERPGPEGWNRAVLQVLSGKWLETRRDS